MNQDRKIFLVRHLVTEFNLSGQIMGGVVDMEVIGHLEEVESLGRKIKDLVSIGKIDTQDAMLFSSPLKRCLQTAAIVKEVLSSQDDVVIDARLKETDMGEFSGRKASELREQYGDLIDQWMYNPEEFRFPGGESYQEVRERANAFMSLVKGILEQKKYVFIVSHVDVIKMIICDLLGKSFNTRREFSIPNGSVSVLGLSEKGEFFVDIINTQ